MKNNILIKFENFLKFLYLSPNNYNIQLSKYYLNNINSTKDAVQLLRYLYMNGYNNSDKIMEKFCYLFTLLSLMYEIVTNTNNREEY